MTNGAPLYSELNLGHGKVQQNGNPSLKLGLNPCSLILPTYTRMPQEPTSPVFFSVPSTVKSAAVVVVPFADFPFKALFAASVPVLPSKCTGTLLD